MEHHYDVLKKAYTRAVIIAISLMVSVLVYVVVAEMLHNLVPPWKGIAFTTDHWYYEYIRCGLLALGVIGVLLAARISTAVNLTPEKLANPVPALLTHSVVVPAACNQVGMFGLVLFLMTGNITDMYIFGGLSLGLSAAFFPRFSRWKKLAESWLSSPASEPDEQKERQTVKSTPWKAWIIIVGGSVFMLVGTAFDRDNALEEEYNLLLWAGFFPLAVIALLYLFYVVVPRSARENGRELDCRPWLWNLLCILIPLFFGLFLVFPVRGALVAYMDLFNETPIQVESVISGVSHSYHCRWKVDLAQKCSICLQKSGHQPVIIPWSLGKMSTDELHKLTGKKVILVGRKSFAGTVIDEIRLPSDKAIERTSLGATDQMR